MDKNMRAGLLGISWGLMYKCIPAFPSSNQQSWLGTLVQKAWVWGLEAAGKGEAFFVQPMFHALGEVNPGSTSKS